MIIDAFHEGGWPMLVVLALGLGAVGTAIAYAIAPQRALKYSSLGLLLGAVVFGFLGAVLGMMVTYGGVAGVDPSMKATLLARGISESMNCTAFGLAVVPAWLLPFFIGVVRDAPARRREPPPAPPGGSITR